MRYEPTVRQNTFVGPVAVGGLTASDAAKKLRDWWVGVKATPIHVAISGHPGLTLADEKPSQMDTILDDEASVLGLPYDNAIAGAEHLVGQAAPTARTDIVPIFKSAGSNMKAFEAEVVAAGNPTPAKVSLVSGQIYTKPEIAGFELETGDLPAEVGRAVLSGNPVQLAVKEAPRHVTDADLAEITDVVSTYTTHFPSYQGNRNNNIKTASGKLSGIILLPGEHLSFNQTVGRRTVQGGFKDAPVYKNGKHDHGIGGGICQVSSTLYNASLLGNLKIIHRSNHSMPVAYVPLGRDATVDYGAIDLEVENSYTTPIAVISRYVSGTLNFTILGKKDPGLSVKIERTGQEDWAPEIDYVTDSKLPAGKQQIVEKGSWGHKIYTYRLIYEDGKLVKREPLGRSYYRPSTRTVARGPVIPSANPAQIGGAPTAPATTSGTR